MGERPVNKERKSCVTTNKSPSDKPKVYVSDKDRMTKVEDNLEKLVTLMTGVAERVEGLETKAKEPKTLPMVEDSEARLAAMAKVTKDGEMGESQKVQDFVNPRAQESGFQENDVVTIKEGTDYYDSHLLDGKPALGMVLNYLYTRKDGQRKYKVNFPKIGKSSFQEKELVMRKPA